MSTTRKHYIVLASNRDNDNADWVIGWSEEEAQRHTRSFVKAGWQLVQVREVGPLVTTMDRGVLA